MSPPTCRRRGADVPELHGMGLGGWRVPAPHACPCPTHVPPAGSMGLTCLSCVQWGWGWCVPAPHVCLRDSGKIWGGFGGCWGDSGSVGGRWGGRGPAGALTPPPLPGNESARVPNGVSCYGCPDDGPCPASNATVVQCYDDFTGCFHGNVTLTLGEPMGRGGRGPGGRLGTGACPCDPGGEGAVVWSLGRPSGCCGNPLRPSSHRRGLLRPSGCHGDLLRPRSHCGAAMRPGSCHGDLLRPAEA
uniref:Uncharacterized protein n=1 Tax=Apteryx owenii TaxID=8824 RepID=A0A8B9QFX5_APTOW